MLHDEFELAENIDTSFCVHKSVLSTVNGEYLFKESWSCYPCETSSWESIRNNSTKAQIIYDSQDTVVVGL